MLNEYDIVFATKDLSQVVKQGCSGTVVMVYNDPQLGYEVEFFDDMNDTLDVLTVEPNDISGIR